MQDKSGSEDEGATHKGAGNMELEVTFGGGLDDLTHRLQAKRQEATNKKNDTVWQAYERRRRCYSPPPPGLSLCASKNLGESSQACLVVTMDGRMAMCVGRDSPNRMLWGYWGGGGASGARRSATHIASIQGWSLSYSSIQCLKIERRRKSKASSALGWSFW